MKMSNKFRTIVCLFLISIISNQIHAGHYRGGAITWTCQGNGMFVFQMKFYRDCNGIPGVASVTLQTTVPTVPTINMNLIQQHDMSPVGIQSNGVTACPNCTQGSSTNPIAGLVEELIYESLPVQLMGVPPLNGWAFSVGECCRPALDNISLATGIGYGLEARMYSYNGQNTQVCFDSSPFFAESPEPMFCTGYPVKYNQIAFDTDRDSIVYSWGVPLTDIYGPIPFAPGYSVNSPLPGPVQNPNNVGATIDPVTGAISFTSYTGGLFMTKVTVSSYRNGIKTAEIYREFMLTLNNNCPPVMGGLQNTPPVVNPPFFNPSTGLQTEYTDTIYPGDTVNFILSFTDFDFFLNGVGQTITVDAAGDLFGLNFTDPTQGCSQPPCATFQSPLPASFPIAGNLIFNWVTTQDHLFIPGTQTLNNRYNFTVTARDNYCPANGLNAMTASVVILPRPYFEPPVLRCASVNNDLSVTLSWTPSTTIDSLNLFESYYIYASLNSTGFYQLVDSVTGINTTSFVHSASALTALFGSYAYALPIFYKVSVNSYGTSPYNPLLSNRLSTIHAQVSTISVNVLNWNAPSNPPLSSNDSYYKVYKEFPLGTWNLVDSTLTPSYVDTALSTNCNDTVAYRVFLNDSTGCIVNSSIDTIVKNDTLVMGTINPLNPAICVTGSVTLDVQWGFQYLWSNGSNQPSITVSIPGNYTVTVTNGTNCTVTATTTVTVQPNPVVVITGDSTICLGTTTILDAGAGYISYIWSTGSPSQLLSVGTAGNYTVSVTDSFGCSGSDTFFMTVFPLPAPQISGDTTICPGQTTTLDAGAGYSNYLWNIGTTTQTITVNTPFIYTVTVTDVNGCVGTDSITVINAPPYPITLNTSGPIGICQGDSVQFDVPSTMSSYQWIKNNVAIPGATTSSYWAHNAGWYKCEAIDPTNCPAESNQLRVSIVCFPPLDPVEKLQQSNAIINLFQVQPNPSSEYFIVQGNEIGSANLTMTNSSGQLISVELTVESDHQIIVSGLRAGVYFMKIETTSGTEVHKIVKIE